MKEGDFIQVKSRLGDVIGYRIKSFKKRLDEDRRRQIWFVCLEVLSPYPPYSSCPELPCIDFQRQGENWIVQEHIVEKISEQEAFLMVI